MARSSGVESLEVTDGLAALEYPRMECSMVRSASCEGSSARHAGTDVELYCVPVIMVNDESAICGGEELIEPCRLGTCETMGTGGRSLVLATV